MINITETAQDHFIKLLLDQPHGTKIRLYVINQGTPYIEGMVSYCLSDDIKKNDIELNFDKLSIYIDGNSAPFLEQAEIDIFTDKLCSKLIIKIPNTNNNLTLNNKKNAHSSIFSRVKTVIATEINPQLASHGGLVSLIEISHDGYAILQFSGGCNGCSMVNFTLKEGIEKKLLHMFPEEIKGVKDLTNHTQGVHTY